MRLQGKMTEKWESSYTLAEQVGGGRLTPFRSGGASPGSYSGTTHELTGKAAAAFLQQGFCVLVDKETAEAVKAAQTKS